jgi:hypothetical protein
MNKQKKRDLPHENTVKCNIISQEHFAQERKEAGWVMRFNARCGWTD